MSLGRCPDREDLYRSTRAVCEARLPATSIHRLLAREAHRLFPDDAFADLFADVGRRAVPPRIVAIVMVPQRLHGMSDREAVLPFAFDLRWKYAAGALDFDHPGFVHTVLVDMRERLRRWSGPTASLKRCSRPPRRRDSSGAGGSSIRPRSTKPSRRRTPKHGGRRARMRGTLRVRQDFALLAAAVNLARLAVLDAATRTA